MEKKLYDFKAPTEGQWAIIVAALGAMAGSIANVFGADAGVVGTTSVTVSSVARGLVGLARGEYEFKAWWEVAWLGVQAGSGALAATIAQTTSADALQTTVIATAASSTGRQVVAALIAAVEKAFSGGLVDPPTS